MSVAVQVGREIAMAEDDGRGELTVKTGEQGTQGLALGVGAGIAGSAEGIETTFVADADGMQVVTFAMGADLPEGTSLMNLPVAGDIIMVADVLPTSMEVIGLALLEGVALRAARGTAMEHNQGDGTHG